MTNSNALIVFAKPPIAGFAKTRLIPQLGAHGAAALHKHLVIHTLDSLVKPADWDTLLWCAGDVTHEFFQFCQQSYSIDLFSQEGNDLGERMYNALSSCLESYNSVCIVGTDCPSLNEDHISEVFHRLKFNDVAINPAFDGGYVLLALNKIDKHIFEKINWGSNNVLSSSLKKIQELDWKYSLMPPLNDVDVPEDLKSVEMQRFFRKNDLRLELASAKL